MAKKQIHINAFEMATPGHLAHGYWGLAGNRRTEYNSLRYWKDLAKLLEEGLFDAVFFADTVGTYDTYKGSRAPALKAGMQTPNLDPSLIIPAMASVTEHLGFALTATTTYEPPYGWARRLSTLDHLTDGRFAWNIVTGYLPDAARSYGVSAQIQHDRRYDIAEEFLQVIYEFLEGSWDDDAVIRDLESNVYTDPDRVRNIRFKGEFFDIEGAHIVEPSPQRTPVLYQAGSSERGKRFAARHGEAVFLLPRDDAQAKEQISDIRRLAVEAGRRPTDVKAFVGLEVVTGHNQEEVDAKVKVLADHRDVEGHLIHFGGASGIDLSGGDTDRYLEYRAGDATQTYEKMWAEGKHRKKVGELVDYFSHPAHNKFFIAGTPDVVADRIEQLIDTTGADGLNLVQHLSPATFRDFIEHVVPELQRRGRYRTAYTPGETLRERLHGPGKRHALAGHPAHAVALRRKGHRDAAE